MHTQNGYSNDETMLFSQKLLFVFCELSFFFFLVFFPFAVVGSTMVENPTTRTWSRVALYFPHSISFEGGKEGGGAGVSFVRGIRSGNFNDMVVEVCPSSSHPHQRIVHATFITSMETL